MDLANWPQVQGIALSGNLQRDVENFFLANHKPHTADHCVRVAKTCEDLAARFKLDSSVASVSGLLHDISAVLPPQVMMEYATSRNWEIDESEQKHPFLLHQRLSVVFARELFALENPVILSAIECHTTLKRNPGEYDMVLFLADKLSWDQQGTPPFFDDVSSALEGSLAHACLVYIRYVMDRGMILFPHRWLLEAIRWLESSV